MLALLLVQGLLSDFCKKSLMNAYNLDGLLEPNHQKNPLCPTIKNNCCTTGDILKVYDKFTNHLKPKLAEYKDKFGQSVRKLKRLHAEVTRLKARQDWQGNQKLYCQSSLEELLRFDFHEMADELRVGFVHAQDYFTKVHTGFLCIFCDYDAQAEIMLSTQTVGVDSGICLDVLNQLKDFLILQNILLVDYLKRVQKFLDCLFFDDKYNLPFTFGQQDMLATDFAGCFEKLTPDSLDKLCEPLCGQLRFGAISPVFEGHLFLILRATDAYTDMVKAIKMKQSMTPFDPLGALQKINQARGSMVFLNMQKKREARLAVMNKSSNKFGVAENNLDDIFRNDISNYPATRREDNIDSHAENNPDTLLENNVRGWDPYYRQIYDPNSAINRAAANQTANALRNIAGSPQGGLGNNTQWNQGNGTNNSTNLTTRWMKKMRKLGQSKSWKEHLKARRLSNAKAIPVMEADGTMIMLHNGQSLSNGMTNSNGVLTRHGKPITFRERKLVQIKHKPVPRKAMAQKKDKLAIKKAEKAARKVLAAKKAEEKDELKKITAKLEQKLGKKVSLTVSPTAADVLEKDAIKTLLGKKNIPVAEEKLLERMAKVIDSQFTAKKKAVKSKRHVRLLEELMAEEDELVTLSHSRGRILSATTGDPKMLLDPIAYHTSLYEAIEFNLNATSHEIYKCLANTPDLVGLKKKYIFNKGVNVGLYFENLGFDTSRPTLDLQLKGQTNADVPDSTKDTLLKTVNAALIADVMRLLGSEFVVIVSPDRQSEDDKELLRAEPTYDPIELFTEIDRQFFNDDFVTHLHRNLPNSYIRQKRMSRNLRQVSQSAELHAALRRVVRPEHLISDKRPNKQFF